MRTIEACPPASRRALCAGVINTREAWYRPDGRTATSVILNAGSGNGRALAAALPSAGLPHPIARKQFGPVSALVYPGHVMLP